MCQPITEIGTLIYLAILGKIEFLSHIGHFGHIGQIGHNYIVCL